MNFLKGAVKCILTIIAFLMIISGGLTCIESLSEGLPIAGGGIAIIVVFTIIRRRKDTKEIRDKEKDNHCKNCGHTLQGAQYRYFYDMPTACESLYGDQAYVPATVYIKCPKCGLEKQIKFHVPPPKITETFFGAKSNDEVYVQEYIRKAVERILRDN